MKIKNICGKIIGFGKLALLPGATDTLPSEFEGNPVVQYYADTGKIEFVPESVEPVEPVEPAEPVDIEKTIDAIGKMKRAELDALAEKLGVPIESNDTIPTLKEKLIAHYRQ